MKLLSVIGLLAICMVAPKQSPWELKKSKDGMKVYTRYIEGTNIKEFKVVSQLEIPVTTMVAVLRDFDNYKNWAKSLKVTKILENVTPNKQIRYVEVDAPWPISNRDAITLTEFTYNKSNKSVRINISSKEEHLPKKDGIVRITGSKGYYSITPKANGKIEFIYQFYSDPGGSLPAWMINTTLPGLAHQTILSLKEEAKKAQYQNKTFDFMK